MILSTVLRTCLDRGVRDLRYRQQQLTSLHKWLVENAGAISTAARNDRSWTSEEAQIVTTMTLDEVRKHYDSLNLSQELNEEYRITHGKDSIYGRVPYGIAYIVPQKSFLLFSTISALCAAITAGNCCLIQVGISYI